MFNALKEQVQPVSSQINHSEVTPRKLAWRSRISKNVAGRTLIKTTQIDTKASVDSLTPILRNYTKYLHCWAEEE